MNLKEVEYNGTKFLAVQNHIDALEVLTSTNAGGISVVHGYTSSAGEVCDISFISRFSYERLNKRKAAKVASIQFADVAEFIAKTPKLASLTDAEARDMFELRKSSVLESVNKTLAGDRSDARREAADRCYLRISEGIRIHYKTVKDANNKAQPIEVDGLPIAESIMVEFLEINRKVITPGEYKEVNSKAETLMGQAIENCIPKSMKFKNLSLKEGNFVKLNIGGNEMLSEDFKGLFD